MATIISVLLSVGIVSMYAPDEAFAALQDYRAIETIDLGQAAKDVVVNPITNKVYIATPTSVVVLDGSNSMVIGNISIGFNLQDLHLDTEANVIYVVHKVSVDRPGYSADHYISIIDGNVDILSGSVAIPGGQETFPFIAGINPHSSQAYFYNGSLTTLYVLDRKTMTTQLAPTLHLPSLMLGDPAMNLIYLASYNETGPVIVSRVNGTTFEVDSNDLELAASPDRSYPVSMVLNQNSQTLYLAVNDYIISTGELPNRTGKIYVIDVSGKQLAIKNEIETGGSKAIEVNSEENLLYETSSNWRFYKIDGFTNAIISYNDGLYPESLAFNPSSHLLYAVDASNGRLSVISDGRDVNPTVDVFVQDKMFRMAYEMSNGGSITGISAGTLDNSEAPGAITIHVDAPRSGYLDLLIPRGMYDYLSFTDHEVLAFSDEMALGFEILKSSSCDRILGRIPIPAGPKDIAVVRSESLLGTHLHPNPPRLNLEKEIIAEGQDFQLGLWTDAIKCDVSFVKEEKKLQIDIEGTANATVKQGYMQVAFPRELIGGNYTVFVDGESVDFVEQLFPMSINDPDSPASNDWSQLSFNYTSKASTIEIVGTSVVPEFGTALTVIVAAISIIAVLLAAVRAKISYNLT